MLANMTNDRESPQSHFSACSQIKRGRDKSQSLENFAHGRERYYTLAALKFGYLRLLYAYLFS